MSEIGYSEISANGLWKNNPALVQVLGLCPLLAVSGSVVNALGLGLATMAVLICSNTAVSLVRSAVPDAIRLPVFVMIIASFVSCVELLMKAYAFELYQILGIFIPLIITNCSILGRADAFACKNRMLPSMIDGLMMGLGFALVLVVLGAARELFGQGTLFANMDLLFGPAAAHWKLTPFHHYPGFLVAVLPPGAFIFTGLMMALKNTIDRMNAERARQQQQAPAPARERVRVTGNIG